MMYRPLLVISLCLLTAAAAAQLPGRVSLSVVTGAGSTVRPGATVPIHVTVQNGENVFDGRVIASFRGAGSETMSANRRVQLPPGSSKRVTLYLPVTETTRSVEVQYVTERGEVVGEFRENLRRIPSGLPVFGAVRELPRGLPPSQDSEQGKRFYSTLFLQPDQLPDRYLGLEMFDALFINPVLEVPITSARVRALSNWVLRGGMLFIDVSRQTDAYGQGRLSELLPLVPQGSNQSQLEIFDREVLYSVGPQRAGDVVLESDGVPLVVRWNYGLGSITAFAVPMEDPALLNWSGLDELWEELLWGGRWREAAARETDWNRPGGVMNLSSFANRLAAHVTEAPSTGLRLGLVLLLTGLYALVAGPGDYFLVRKLGRPKLTWITFPIIVAVFTFAAYIGAKYWIGGEWESKHTRATTVFPDIDLALNYDLTGIFAPRADEYVIHDERGSLPREIGLYTGTSDHRRIDLDDNVVYQEIPIWTHRVFTTSVTTDAYSGLNIDVQVIDGRLQLTVLNESDGPLQMRAVAARGKLWRPEVEEIPVGGQETVTFRTEYGTPFQEPGLLWLNRGPRPVRAEGNPDALGWTPLSRPFRFRDAMRRGAVFVLFETDRVESPLIVEGESAETELGTHLIQVLKYGLSKNEGEQRRIVN